MSQPSRPIKPSSGTSSSSRPQPVKATQPFTLRQPSPTKPQPAASTKKSPRSSPSLFTSDRFSPRGRVPTDSRSSPERRSPVAVAQAHLNNSRDRSRPGFSQRVPSPGNNTSLPRTGSLDTLYVSGGCSSSPAVPSVTPRVANKSTQTSAQDPQVHKRSNSLGSSDYKGKLRQNYQRERHSSLTPVQGNHQSPQLLPLLRLSPQTVNSGFIPMQSLGKTMRCSIEGLNQEVETIVFSTEDMKSRPLTPDGRKAPVIPILQRQSSVDVETQTATADLLLYDGTKIGMATPTESSPGLLTMVQQPIVSLSPLLLGQVESVGNESPDHTIPYRHPPPSPKCSFARDPPVGVERVTTQEYRKAPVAIVSGGPDPSKVGFVLKSDGSTPFLRFQARRSSVPMGPVVKGPLTSKTVSPQTTAVGQ